MLEYIRHGRNNKILEHEFHEYTNSTNISSYSCNLSHSCYLCSIFVSTLQVQIVSIIAFKVALGRIAFTVFTVSGR